ncbi:(2Fe-2S) ferredoxin domain-containing protein [Nocardioides alcanivorans]|uniref:(2Fe-2S) ferredoxin domain-containing protein n=1 Tax=Nocardioides alcanivorans TaxID=2897352 RepID=UPI001F1CB1D7|nr:(2Fe-2S) ferredoxin domain-containing protein [Nocardioides alcanivorans]
MTAHVLVGTSPTDAARRLELFALAARLGAEPAFLQLASPSLGQVLDQLAVAGETRIVLVGVSGGIDGPGVSWLRRIAADWWRTYGECAPEVATAPGFLSDPDEWSALVDLARPITHGGAGLTSAAWEDVPEHRHQVLVCRGPRCTALGVEEATRGLVIALMRQGLGDDDVLVTHTGCQFPCNQAPVLSVQPDDVWYGRVDAPTAERIVAEHLVSGVPVAEARLPRRRGA